MQLDNPFQSSDIIPLAIVVLASVAILRAATSKGKDNVPIIGSSLLFGYLTAIKTPGALRQYMTEGYYKYKSHAFQIPGLRAWVVMVSGKYVEEIRKAREDTLSINEELNDLISMEYTLGKTMADNQWHISVIRKQLTSNLAALFPAVYDEVSQGFEDELKFPNDGEWRPFVAYEVILRVVCRAGNRMFVGLPLCRDPLYNKISKEFTPTVSKAGFLISVFPKFLKPFVARYYTKLPQTINEFETFLIPLIEERLRDAAAYGDDWKDKPNDFLQWMIDTAEGDQRSPKDLTLRMLGMNFAATHTTSMTFTHAFYNLAAYPQYADPLREEVEAAFKEHGYTKNALAAMVKADSFLRETTRLNSITAVSMNRKVMKDFTFSDGTMLRQGSHVSANLHSVHHDPSIYPDPLEFDPWRFLRRVESGESAVKNLLTTAGTEFLTWGYGAHACPGRYFASQEMKAMLAYVLLHYDVRMPEGAVRPPNVYFERSCIPNKTAEVLFRRRA